MLAFDVYYNYFELNENLFKKNNGNGLLIMVGGGGKNPHEK